MSSLTAGVSRSSRRREELALTAARQFQRLGYHQVTMADVARTAGLTAPALYRHFKNKQALLAAAISSGLDVVDEMLEKVDGSWDDVLLGLAGTAMARPDLWVLVQREMRHLEPELRAELDSRLVDIVATVSERLVAERPGVARGTVGLLVTATLGAIASPPLYRLDLPRVQSQRLIASAAGAASRVTLVVEAGGRRPEAEAKPRPCETDSRGELLLEAAVALFNERGYGAVSLDEIGAAVGMAGPSIYHHFATKADLLVSAFMRAVNWLAGPGGAAPVEPSHPRAVMEMLVQRYVDLAVSHRDLFGVYLSEAVNLPPEAGRRIASALRSDVDQWTESLVAMRPGLPAVQARLLVLAARGAVTDVVRLGLFLERPDIAAEIGEIVFAVLGADPVPD